MSLMIQKAIYACEICGKKYYNEKDSICSRHAVFANNIEATLNRAKSLGLREIIRGICFDGNDPNPAEETEEILQCFLKYPHQLSDGAISEIKETVEKIKMASIQIREKEWEHKQESKKMRVELWRLLPPRKRE